MSISNIKLSVIEQFLIIKQKLVGTRRRQLAVLLTVFISCLAIGIVVVLVNREPTGVNCKKTLNKSCIILEAKNYLQPKDSEKLQPIIGKIKSTKNYEFDPDLLFIITTYYVNRSDGQNAKLYFDKFYAVFDPNQGIDERLPQDTTDVSTLQRKVDFLQMNDSLLKNSVQYGPSPKL